MSWVDQRITPSGALSVWGDNSAGQLGIGSALVRSVPIQVGTATNWATVSNGADHAIALRSDGTLWAWGRNLLGQLGDGTTTNHTTPEQIGSDTNWSSVCGRPGASHGTQDRRHLVGVGLTNLDGELGDGTLTGYGRSPTQVGSRHRLGVGGRGWLPHACHQDERHSVGVGVQRARRARRRHAPPATTRPSRSGRPTPTGSSCQRERLFQPGD